MSNQSLQKQRKHLKSKRPKRNPNQNLLRKQKLSEQKQYPPKGLLLLKRKQGFKLLLNKKRLSDFKVLKRITKSLKRKKVISKSHLSLSTSPL